MFDRTGKITDIKSKVQAEQFLEGQKFTQDTANRYYRLKLIEKYYFKWMGVGRDMRVNIGAVFASVVCFCVVFFPVNFYENRHYLINLKARVPKESIDPKNYKEFLYETGKKSRMDYDIFRNLHSI